MVQNWLTDLIVVLIGYRTCHLRRLTFRKIYIIGHQALYTRKFGAGRLLNAISIFKYFQVIKKLIIR
jgi:hypothetical protein